ncbi:diguanylate cyclase [Sulfurimonas sp. C5]|uniref:diguanylate cyclase n=1 Tax=Sulfurimonas sp. C5 TaxID=3036947 RepID=UPI002453B561|nr:diguanylate cyclase [Sulfurimonas sp. C5]MDH4944940.1 sensor domain-containing diguanylate cyclase [Sulfurimonas sp. C5]
MRILFLLLIFLLPLSANIVVSHNEECAKNFSIEYYYDDTNTLSIEDIQTKTFVSTSNNFTFGYLRGTTWFKITIDNNSSEENFIISFYETLWKTFNFYQLKDHQWDIQYNGLDVPLNQRDVKSIYPTFKLHVPSHTSKTVYIQGNTLAGQIGQFLICTQESYFSESRFEIVDLYMIFAFSLFSILILNLYSYFLTDEKVYLYYVLYTFTFIIFSAMQSGFYLFFGFEGWNEGLHVVGTFVLITLILFSDTFLHLEEHLKFAHKFFQVSIGVFLVFAILIFNNIPYTSLLFNIYSIIFFAMLFYASIKAYIHGYIGAKYYLIALVIYSATMGIMILTFNALIDYTLVNRHLFVLGAFIEIIFFTLILANKYRTITLEKLSIQDELLKEKNKNEEELKLAVEERTEELEGAKKALENLVGTDNLTKIKNRRAYKEKIEELLSKYNRHHHPFCMIIFDIDDFKTINDTYGHQMGDIVLMEITELVSRHTRINDYFFRIGGEEFALLLENTSLEKAKKLAQHIVELIGIRLKLIKGRQITVSMGLTEVVEGDNEDSIYKRTDSLLYKSKQNGKNQVSY